MFSKAEGTAICHFQLLSFQIQLKEAVDHVKCFCICNYSGIWINLKKVGYICSVIRLHVLYDQIVWFAAIQDLIQIIQPFMGKICIYSVHNCNFFIQDHIGIVCHSIWYFILAFEKVHLVIVYACVFDGICDLHGFASLIRTFLINCIISQNLI